MSANTSPQIYSKPKGATRYVGVNFTDLLEWDDTLSGSPTVTRSSTTVTVSGAAINSSGTTVILGTTVAANKAVSFLVASGSSGTRYNFNISIGTAIGQTLIWNVLLDVTGNTT